MGRTRKSRGIITVFVTLIMIPVIVCTGIFVDAARIKLYSAQAAMTADAYGEVVLSEYDYILKELYGLFAISQDQAGMDAIKELAKCTGYSFTPAADGTELNGYMPYANATVTLNYTEMPGAVLSNDEVLVAQISDFMRFRGLEVLANNVGLLDTLTQVDSQSNDMDAVSQRTKITKNSAKILGKIDTFYQYMQIIDDYPEYCNERIDRYEDYSKDMKDVYFREEAYQFYLEYLEKKDEIEKAIKALEDAEKADKEATELSEDGKEITDAVDALPKETVELAEKYRDYDAAAYRSELIQRFAKWDMSVGDTNKKIKFDEVSAYVTLMETLAGEIDTCIAELNQQVTQLEGTLENCSDGLRYGSDRDANEGLGDGMESEIAGLKEITKMYEEFSFTDMVNWLKTNENGQDDDDNLFAWGAAHTELDDIADLIVNGTKDIEEWDDTIRFDWEDFQDDPTTKDFYEKLGEICNGYKNGKSGVAGDEDAAENQINNAEEVAKKAKEKSGLDKDETTTARSISDTLAKELEGATSGGEVTEAEDSMKGFSLGQLGANAVSTILLVMYDYEMFSSRVSGIEVKSDDPASGITQNMQNAANEVQNGGEEEFYDESLTKVKMSPDVNYLYGAELEYLVAGHTSSTKNLTQTRNVICGIRLASNFVSTYSIPEINSVINGLADAAATAVVAGTAGLGAAAYPLIKAAVSGALRLTVATLEMIEDWKQLTKREKVVFYKSKLGDLTAIDTIADFLGMKKDDLEKSGGFEMGYEEYLFLMLCITAIDRETLLNRTADLITLNVNKCQTDNASLKNNEMTSLSFKMSDAVTAIQSTCSVNLDFIIVPKGIFNVFITDENTRTKMDQINETGYGHSVIRGY